LKENQTETEDNAMFTKKPYGPVNCASCEKDIVNLDGVRGEFLAWKRLPFREANERIAKYGPGFSKMLNSLKTEEVTLGIDASNDKGVVYTPSYYHQKTKSVGKTHRVASLDPEGTNTPLKTPTKNLVTTGPYSLLNRQMANSVSNLHVKAKLGARENSVTEIGVNIDSLPNLTGPTTNGSQY